MQYSADIKNERNSKDNPLNGWIMEENLVLEKMELYHLQRASSKLYTVRRIKTSEKFQIIKRMRT